MNACFSAFMHPFAERTVRFLIQESVYSALVFAVVWIISKWTRSRYPLLQTGLWLLVFLRLMLPTDLSHPLSGRNLLDRISSWKTTERSLLVEWDEPSQSNRMAGNGVEPAKPIRFFADGDFVLFGVWLLGVVALALMLAVRLNRYRRMIQKGIAIETGPTMEILKIWQRRLGIRRRIKLVVIPDSVSPFTIGSLRPVVVIPDALLTDGRCTDLESVIGHETAHVKRWDDLWIKLQNLVQIIYFFHPAVWIAGNRLNLGRECACDRIVLAQKRIDRTRYAHGLINMLKLQPFGPDCVALIPSFSKGRNSLFTRLQNMKGEHHMRTTHKIGAVCLLMGLAVIILPMAAASLPEKSQKEDKSQTTATEFSADSIVIDKNGNQTITTIFKTKASNPGIRLIKPVKGPISSGFGMRKHPITGQDNFHNAIDIKQKKGTPVLAAADGKVISVKARDIDPKGAGRFIVLRHKDGFETTYTQLDSILVEEGADISQDEKIGLVGESGLSTAPHLHFEVRLNGEPVDPEKYIVK